MRTIKAKIILSASLPLLFCICAQAQNTVEHQVFDTTGTAFVYEPQIDSTYYGIDIFDALNKADGGGIAVYQSPAVEKALRSHIAGNHNRKIQGYRVRIFLDNGQNARSKSASIAQSFARNYPEVRVYRSHVSPNFKVTVGDFRTKKDAQMFAAGISSQYPSVFVVKEDINYPDK